VSAARDTFVLSGPNGVELRAVDGRLLAAHQPIGLDEVEDSAISADGRSVYFVGSTFDQADGSLTMKYGHLALPSLEPMGPMVNIPIEDRGFSMATSPDGKKLAIGTQGGELIDYDLTTHELVRPIDHIDSAYIGALAWSADSRVIYAGGQDGTLRAYDPTGTTPAAELSLSPFLSLTDIVFTADGSQMMVSSESGDVFFVDVATFKQIGQSLTSGGTQLQAVDVSPDGSTVAAISRDGAVRLWDAATHRSLGPPVRSHTGLTTEISFNADGTSVVTYGFDDAIVTIDLRPEAQATKACELVRRNLTKTEWGRYLPGQQYRVTCPQYPVGT
jgi:WD40 repeat protein